MAKWSLNTIGQGQIIWFLKTLKSLLYGRICSCYIEESVVVHILSSVKILWALYSLYQSVFVCSTELFRIQFESPQIVKLYSYYKS